MNRVTRLGVKEVPHLLLSAVKSHGVICTESNLRERKMRGGRHSRAFTLTNLNIYPEPANVTYRYVRQDRVRVYALSWLLDFDFTYSYIEYSINLFPLSTANLGIAFSHDHGGRQNPSLSARLCSQ